MHEYCYECDKVVDIAIKEEEVEMEIKGIKFTYPANIPYCMECGNGVYVSALDDENVKRANQKYRELAGIIQTSEIKVLLDKYDIGQKPLARLLGWSEVTIIRYIQGLTPEREYSNRLKELFNPLKMQELLNRNCEVLTSVARRKLELRIDELMGISHKPKAGNEIEARDVAFYFLTQTDVEAGELITHLKLQKLVYYAQSWCLAFFQNTLINEDFQAWQHGPVAASLYHYFKHYGFDPVPEVSIINEGLYSLPYRNLLNVIWSVYGKYDAKYLERLTHMEEPWRAARGDCQDDEKCNNIISKESIRDYYTCIKEKHNIERLENLEEYVSSLRIR